MKLSNIFFAVVIGLFISCADTEPKEAQLFNEKMEKTIAIHDEVMPEMSKLTRLITTLEKEADSTNAESYEPVIYDLKTGHDKMMTWMKNFGDEFSKIEINQGIQLKNIDSLKTRLEALDVSYKEAVDMRDHIKEAIKNADALIK